MKTKKDMLFSIQNEELKEERKYALLTMKITFMYFCLVCIGYPLFIAWNTFFNQPFIISYFSLFLMSYLPFIVGFLGVTLLILNALRKLHFRVCYIVGILNLLFSLSISLIDPSQINSISVILTFVLGILLLIAPYRVQTFLQSQKTSLLSECKESRLDGLPSNDNSPYKKNRETEQNTLFSIKDEELRAEREYSLWIMRLSFLLFCIFCINFFYGVFSFPLVAYQSIMFSRTTASIILLSIFSILFALIARGLWKLRFWSYFLLGSLSILFFVLSLKYITKYLVFTADIYTNLVGLFMNGIALLIAAWRVRSFLKKQKKKRTD